MPVLGGAGGESTAHSVMTMCDVGELWVLNHREEWVQNRRRIGPSQQQADPVDVYC